MTRRRGPRPRISVGGRIGCLGCYVPLGCLVVLPTVAVAVALLLVGR